MKHALVIGATGLVGKTLTQQLLLDDYFSKVTLLVRKPMDFKSSKLEQIIFDFEQPDISLVKGDVLFCAMGTTLKKAGSKEKQYLIDCAIPLKIAEIAKRNGVEECILVSSIGADAHSSNFYLKTKGELEQKLNKLGFGKLVCVRPSLIIGNREEFRLGEKIGMALDSIFRPLLIGSLRKYRGVSADKIAKMLVKASKESFLQRTIIIESDEINALK